MGEDGARMSWGLPESGMQWIGPFRREFPDVAFHDFASWAMANRC